MQYYILTSSGIEGISRHSCAQYSNIPKEDMVIIINTQDLEYAELAQQYCISHGIEHYVTESNGTPGKGKNSLLEKFLESDNDYCVQIDGDDFLTPHGVWLYNHLAQTESPPDALCLREQVSITHRSTYIPEFIKEHGFSPTQKDFSTEMTRPFYTNYNYLVVYEALDYDNSIIDYLKLQKRYSEPYETHCRITWYSRKAAQYKFREDLYVGEDTLHYFNLKDLHVNGHITFMSNTESPPTYIYDQSLGGIVVDNSNLVNGELSWLNEYMKAASNMELNELLHDNEHVVLPKLEISYPCGYEPNVLGLIGNAKHEVTQDDITTYIEYPSNGTKQGLINKYKLGN
tara:strand:+ start:60 stop:1091 length:1032 start_codon:yes stop_codon:yes gene_type:complete